MAEATRYIFTFKEVTEALIKQQGLHEGLWMFSAEFGLGAVNIGGAEGSKELSPAAIVPIKSVGLQQGTEDNSLTVDAAKVNPKPKSAGQKKKA